LVQAIEVLAYVIPVSTIYTKAHVVTAADSLKKN
jgi:hypothetical protein